MKRHELLPNFLIVGAERAGTTSLAALLALHPDVFMCVPKEARFFSEHNWERGLAWYQSLFKRAEGYKAVGEASPSYTCAPRSVETPKRIYETLGDIKYVYIVRNPVDRLLSHYRHALHCRWIPDGTSLEDAIQKSPGIKDCSRYYYQLEQYFPYTSAEQWQIVVLEELIADPIPVQRRLLRFLNVDDSRTFEVPKENVSEQRVRLPMWCKPLKRLYFYAPQSVVRTTKRVLSVTFGERVPKPSVPNEVLKRVAAEFEPDVERLSEFLGRDLKTIWEKEYF